MKNRIVLKKASAEDIPALVKIDAQAFNREYDNRFTAAEFKDIFAKDGETGFIVFDGQPVGYYSWVVTGPDSVEIMSLAVIPEYQKKGIGRTTFGMIMQRLEKVKDIKLVTHPRNIHALIIYMKEGFIVTGFSKEHYGPGQDRVVLEYRRR
jgi:ribosomal protein S18 acetylase RimI-like enzyme